VWSKPCNNPKAPQTHPPRAAQAAAYFPKALYRRLESDLLAYGERTLGCRSISPIWMSYYVEGCLQELHCGAFAFLLGGQGLGGQV